MPVHTSQLDEFVEFVRSTGCDFTSDEIVQRFGSVKLLFDSVVDETLSPFSQEYLDHQLRLYREISGRSLNQEDGELHPVDFERLLQASNPIGMDDVSHICEHVRTLSTMLGLTTLSKSAKVLDMGAGHGISSEIFAFTGCRVHAVDIDPVLGKLSRQRSAARGYSITRSDANFDQIGFLEDGAYDAAFFFQSLHHCITPWKLISDLKGKLTDNGVIAFAGEPIQQIWWKNWGIRLDVESIYVAREHGWFESGWSKEFITECFSRNGFTLDFFPGGANGGEIGVATKTEAKRQQVHATNAVNNAPKSMSIDDPVPANRFLSLTGEIDTVFGRPGFRQKNDAPGILMYGPYVSLDHGTYEMSAIIALQDIMQSSNHDGTIILDVVASFGQSIVMEEEFSASEVQGAKLIVRRFVVPEKIDNVEIRARHSGMAMWRLSLPTLRKVE